MAEFSSLGELLPKRKRVKPPAYPWQDLALRVIAELNVPLFKRNSVFLVCKTFSQKDILQALTDTKELCGQGSAWQYFFKVLANQKADYAKQSKTGQPTPNGA